ncbi:hypothetical protein [Rhodopila sp.]|uniref:hypothetical protein n=1 Tax=Rhodopila sp. TaxID=2480087 RepID=UPI003D11F821
MHDNPIHTFLLFLTGQIPDQVALGDLRWLTVALYWFLLIGGIAIAVVNWRRDPAQRTGYHLCVFSLRMVAAGMWWLGTLWKLPLPVSAGFKFWLAQTVKYSALSVHSDIMQIFLNHIAVVQPLVYLSEVFFTASLMLGFLVRLSGVLAALFTLNLLIGLYNDPTEWPWTYVGIIGMSTMFALTGAGRSLGLDSLLRLERPLFLTSETSLARVYDALS